MPSSSDLLLGKIAVKLRYLTEQQLQVVLQIQERENPPRALGAILVEKKLITLEQLQTIVEIQKKRMEMVDPSTRERKEMLLFGKIVVQMKLATLDQVNECLRTQAKESPGRTLGELMVERGILTPEQVQAVLGRQQKKIMSCAKCKLTFTVVTTTGATSAKCPRCQSPLQERAAQEGVRTDAEFGTMISRAVDAGLSPRPAGDALASTSKMIATQCVICDESFTAPPDGTGRVRCPKCFSSFVPRRKR